MSILTQLHHFGISPDSLSNMDERDIVRIEKRLKAQAKLDQSIDINETEQIVAVLKHNRTELIYFFHDDLTSLRKILTKQGHFQIFTQPTFKDVPSDNFRAFLRINFSEQITGYVRNCLNEDHYNALNSILYYHSYFDEQLLDSISQKMMKKITFGKECIDIRATNILPKIDHLSNPYFYRCLNLLGPTQFEEIIGELTSSLIKVIGEASYYYKVVFAMNSFAPSAKAYKAALEKNAKTAEIAGVIETPFIPEQGKTKGGTEFKFKSNKFTFPQDRKITEEEKEIERELAREKEREQEFIDQLSKDNPEETKIRTAAPEKKSSKKGLPIIFAFIILIGLIKVVSYFRSETSYKKPTTTQVYKNILDVYKPEQEDTTEFFVEDHLITENDSVNDYKLDFDHYTYNFSSLKEIQNYFTRVQTGLHITTSAKNIPFVIDSTKFSSEESSFTNTVIKYSNATFKPMVVFLYKSPSRVYNIFIPAKSSTTFRCHPEGLAVYTGTNPQIITYQDENGIEQKDFRFNNFSKTDKRTLNSSITFDSNQKFWNPTEIVLNVNGFGIPQMRINQP